MPPDDVQPIDLAPLCAETALRLLQHGAESALVESLARRVGLALGAERVEIALMANAVTITVRIRGRSKTTVRRNEDRGINMAMVMDVQRLVLEVEAGRLDRVVYRERLLALVPFHHRRWLVAILVGLSCACFARLNHGDWAAFALVAVSSGVAMAIRQRIAQLHFSPLVVFAVTAFSATSLTMLGLHYDWSTTPKAAMAATVLLLVPGYPLINSVSDMVKGYINTGISRGVFATLLSAATCVGIVAAMTSWGVWDWLSAGPPQGQLPAVAAATPLLLETIQDILVAAVPAVGFGMLFNVPTPVLGSCAVFGGFGHGLRFVLLRLGFPIEVATLVAASVISFGGVWRAQQLRAHPKVFTVAAVIPMIPGVPLFTALITIQQIYQRGLTKELFAQAVSSGLRAFFVIGALAIGLAMPGLVIFRRRPVV